MFYNSSYSTTGPKSNVLTSPRLANNKDTLIELTMMFTSESLDDRLEVFVTSFLGQPMRKVQSISVSSSSHSVCVPAGEYHLAFIAVSEKALVLFAVSVNSDPCTFLQEHNNDGKLCAN